MKILVIGAGGREHALAWKLAQSPQVQKVYVAPGNAGTAQEHNLENVTIAANDLERLLDFALCENIDLTIVGPEAPLAMGIVDSFRTQGLAIFGPTKACAQLEASKAFSKDFMRKYDIPTAFYQTFTDSKAAIAYIKKQGAPIVVKADGLAAGKGVIVAQTETQAITAVEDMLSGNKFGNAGAKVVIEECLSGEELSFIAMVDGQHILPMATSQDHKARDDGDQGPNTGGMGAYSPAPAATLAIEKFIMQHVMQPVVKGMREQGTPYSGFLYAGLMLTPQGPKVLEFNCRFGDPETQPIMLRLKSDFAELCKLACLGKLNQATTSWDERAALGVVMASRHYPDDYPKGDEVKGLDYQLNDVKVFHAGTQLQEDKVVTNGGRVLCVTALDKQLLQAQRKAYEVAAQIHWGCEFYRHDIGNKAIDRDPTKLA